MTADEGQTAGPLTHTDRTFPWFPTYVQDWLAIPGTPELKGALMNLRCFAWQQDPPCTVPDDDGVLAAITGLHDRWAAVGTTFRAMYLQRYLDPQFAGRLYDPLLLARFRIQVELSISRRTAGKVGGKQSANGRANGNPRSKQPAPIASLVALNVASGLPDSVWSLESGTTDKDKTLKDLQQQASNDEANGGRPSAAPDPEKESYDARLADLYFRYQQKFPDAYAELEAQARRELQLTGRDTTGDGVASKTQRAAIEDRVHKLIREQRKVPTYEELQQGLKQGAEE